MEAYYTRSPAVAKMVDRYTGCQWYWKSSNVDDFHFIWKSYARRPTS